ncbi:acylneuraminate cytidylyltransferase family protein [Pararhizobium sp. LjRoot235]|uniref:acylneuraminate cytidylyltransferase family protein n=1 Tax=Pararhizobium sp. LjRoot235 TaxID=3342291 RepID=UPI003ECD41FB
MNILGYIPARLGSERTKAKNLRLLNGAPLISYVIQTCKSSKMISQFFVNTESDEIAHVSRELGMDVYLRDPALAGSQTKTDEIVIDFLRRNPCDAVVLVNPTAPFLKPETIDAAIEMFLSTRADALFSTNTLRKHALMNGIPLNFDPSGPSPRTQDLEPIVYINFIICIFRSATAIEHYERTGSFLYKGKLEFMHMTEEQSVDIDYDIDFRMAEALMRTSGEDPRYHDSVQ